MSDINVSVRMCFEPSTCMECSKEKNCQSLLVSHAASSQEIGPYCADCFPVSLATTHTVLLEGEQETYKVPTKRVREVSKKQERKTAELLGGDAQKASGALPWAKGDVRVKGELRVEEKFTYADSYRVALSDLEKIRSETYGTEDPMFVVKFLRRANNAVRDVWVLLPLEAFMKRLRGKKDG